MMSRLFYPAAISTLLCTLLVAAAGIQQHAASPSVLADPWVVVATDVTNQSGSCTETLAGDINSTHPTVYRFPCPAGTIVKSEKIRRSDAIARHEAYIVLPVAQADLKLTQQTEQTKAQIFQLMEKKSLDLRQTTRASLSSPAYTCGQENAATLKWSVYNNGTYNSKITYYLSSNCGAVSLDTSSITPVYDPNYFGGWLYWDHDQYASGSWTVNGSPYLYPGTTYSNYDGLSKHTPGYYYENWTHGAGGDWYHNDFGPLG